ncbi:MAG TPA: DUF1003 domain-containing protein [Allosphingosinicella sp.]|jgi:uncharacterized membrane protein
MARGPTVPPPQPGSLKTALERNIAALERRRREEAAQASFQQRLAEKIASFTGSMLFVYVHLFLYGFWILANLGFVPGVPAWDDTFVVLAMIASVEAIFLSTFILITQNRMAALADRRADLDLQISLLAEHELTKVVAIVDAIADHLGVRHSAHDEVDELKQDVAPEAVLDAISSTEDAPRGGLGERDR